MRVFILLIPLLLAGFGARAAEGTDTVTVSTEGVGATRHEAILNGLAEAVSQVHGVRFRFQQNEWKKVTQDDPVRNFVDQQTERIGVGYIKSYQVIEVKEGPPIAASLTVDVIRVLEPTGLANRKRMVIGTFGGGDGRSGAIFASALTRHLVQTRRFMILDRSARGDLQSELALLAGPDVSPIEATRLSRALGADLLLRGVLTINADTNNASRLQDPATARLEHRGEVQFEIVDVATRQIKLSRKKEFRGFAAQDAILDRAASDIAGEIARAIYPVRIINHANGTRVVLDQGGSQMQIGQRWKIYRLGNELASAYTNEALGPLEDPAGELEIFEVSDKIAYGRLVTGALEEGLHYTARPMAAPLKTQKRNPFD